MAFVQVNISDEIEKQRAKSPEFKKAWDESREEYRLINRQTGEFIEWGRG